MLRRGLRLLVTNNPYKVGGDAKSSNTPFETKDFSQSFEKIVAVAASNPVFPITANMYDRPGVRPYSTNPDDAINMPNQGRNGAPVENKTAAGQGALLELQHNKEFMSITGSSKAQLPWERIYEPEAIKMSQLSEEYYYEPEITLAQRQAQLKRWAAMAVLVTAVLTSWYLLYLITPREATFFTQGGVGNTTPTWGVPHRAPEGYEIVRMDPKDPTKPLVLPGGR